MYAKLIRRLKNEVKTNLRLKIIPEPRLARPIKERSPAEFIIWCMIRGLKIKVKSNQRLLQIPEIKTARGLNSESPAEFIS